MDEKSAYDNYLEKLFEKYENLCRRCGSCCGLEDNDPCVNLKYDSSTKRYFCKNYNNRIGPQRTISGKVFKCVRIGELIKHGLAPKKCSYNIKNILTD